MARSTPASPDAPGTDERLRPLPGRAVSRVVGRLQSGYRQDAPWAVATVARLRREAGRDAYASPGAWGLGHLEELAELREQRDEAEREARGAGTPDPAHLSSGAYLAREVRERREDAAVHLAVTLWALHQQSLRDDAMHRWGWPLGRSVRRLAQGGAGVGDAGASEADGDEKGRGRETGAPDEAAETVRRRLVRVGGASDIEVLATRLRELVLLLRNARIPLDYALLADQLFRWQDENQRDTVRRAWGRDYHRRHHPVGTGAEDGERRDPAGDPPDAAHDGAGDPEEYDDAY